MKTELAYPDAIISGKMPFCNNCIFLGTYGEKNYPVCKKHPTMYFYENCKDKKAK